MCGRYTATFARRELEEHFRTAASELVLAPRYNVAPTQEVPAISIVGGERAISLMRWGLPVPWTERGLINARIETVATKTSFRHLLGQRCLIAADSFYEWRVEGQARVPHRVTLAGQQIFAFAALWAGDGTRIPNTVILTTQASSAMAELHSRMPVILADEQEYEAWLTAPIGDALARQKPYAGEISITRVSRLVNSARFDHPDCIAPYTGEDMPRATQLDLFP